MSLTIYFIILLETLVNLEPKNGIESLQPISELIRQNLEVERLITYCAGEDGRKEREGWGEKKNAIKFSVLEAPGKVLTAICETARKFVARIWNKLKPKSTGFSMVDLAYALKALSVERLIQKFYDFYYYFFFILSS